MIDSKVAGMILDNESQKPDDEDEARAIHRLMAHPDWPVWENRMKRELALALRKLTRATGYELVLSLNGAALQQERIAGLPGKMVKTAEKKRGTPEPEEEDGERKLGRRIEPTRVQP